MTGFRELDRILRGEVTGGETLGEDGGWRLEPLARVLLILAAAYGLCMGTYGVFRPGDPEFRQLTATVVKVPLLFALTFLVTFPSLYVFNTMLGSRLRAGELLRLVVSGMGILLAVLAAFGPIVAFFSVTTTSYPFVVLLNVAVFAVSGVFGIGHLYRTLRRLPTPTVEADAGADFEPVDEPVRPAPVVARPVVPGRSNVVFYVWMAVFALVGGQMGWVLRPFIGSPELSFTWFRPREASFFEGVFRALKLLLGA